VRPVSLHALGPSSCSRRSRSSCLFRRRAQISSTAGGSSSSASSGRSSCASPSPRSSASRFLALALLSLSAPTDVDVLDRLAARRAVSPRRVSSCGRSAARRPTPRSTCRSSRPRGGMASPCASLYLSLFLRLPLRKCGELMPTSSPQLRAHPRAPPRPARLLGAAQGRALGGAEPREGLFGCRGEPRDPGASRSSSSPPRVELDTVEAGVLTQVLDARRGCSRSRTWSARAGPTSAAS